MPNMLFPSQTQKTSCPKSIVTMERRKELHASAVNCIVRDGLPFDIFRRSGMSDFLNSMVPGYRGPHRKTVRNQIGRMYSTHTQNLCQFFSEIDVVALTSDIWKNSRQIYFISLTAHTFSKNFENISIVVGCRRLIGPHQSSSIEQYINYEINRLGIKREQIISIITDNGSNIKKATSSLQYGFRVSCMGHNLNLVVNRRLALWHEPKENQ